jgi:hypothetical protein
LVSICPFFFLVFLFLSHTFSIGLVFLISISLKVYSHSFLLSFCPSVICIMLLFLSPDGFSREMRLRGMVA